MWKMTRICSLLALTLLVGSPVSAAAPDKLLPETTDMLVNINTKALLESEVVKKHALDEIKNFIKNNDQLGAILTQLNFDPLKDLSSITVAATLGNNPQQPDVFIIARGNYDVDKVQETLAAVAKNMPEKVAVSEYGKFKVYEFKGQGARNQGMFGAFLDKNTLIAATKKADIEAGIDRGTGKKTSKFKKEFTAAVEKLGEGQTLSLVLVMSEGLKRAMAQNGQLAGLAEKLEAGTLGLVVKDNVVADLALHTTDNASAMQFSEGISQLKNFFAAAVERSEDKELGPVFAKILKNATVSADGPRVKIRAEIDADSVDKLAKKAKAKLP